MRKEAGERNVMVENLKKKPQKRRVQNSRETALDILCRIFQQQEDMTPLPVMLGRASLAAGLGSRNAAFLAELVYGVLRRTSVLDTALAVFLKKPTALSAQVRMLLRLGGYELLFMGGVPARATVNECVGLARRRFGQGIGGLVNAVLRSMAREVEALRRVVEAKEDNVRQGKADAGTLAEVASLPLWLPELWLKQYGEGVASSFVLNSMAHPAPCWRVNMKKPWGEMLLQHWTAREYMPVGLCGFSAQGLDRERPDAGKEQGLLESFERQGALTRQGASSQLLTEYLARWILQDSFLAQAELWDACCGRGGKSTALLEKGVRVSLASDPSAFRLNEFRSSLQRLGLPFPKILCGQAQTIDAVFPMILLDVPCSGTGTLGRNAELRHRISQERMVEITRVQEDILESSWRKLQDGGTLFYVTCALNREENELQIQRFVHKHEQHARLIEQKLFFPDIPGQDSLFLGIVRKV